MPKRKKRTEEEFHTLFVAWIQKLELLHWHFDLDLEADLSESDRDCEIRIADDYHRAHVKFDKKGWREEWSDETLERNIAHELIHIHFERLLDAATVTRGMLHKGELELYDTRVDHELEKAVDRIAAALVRSFV